MADSEVATANPEVMGALSRLDDTLQSLPTFPHPPTSGVEASRNQKTSGLSLFSEESEPQLPSPPDILDNQLQKAVFTHSACSGDSNSNYDRLEILGDAYIELIATRLVWQKFPGIPAGRISQIRELLVKNATLAGFAEAYGFDRRALVPANYSDQPKRWIKTKGDIFEAYVAAVILSRPEGGGYELAEQWLTSLWLPKLSSLGHQKASLRSKEALAQQIMARDVKLEYLEERQSIQKKGAGTQTFFIGVYLTGWGWTKRHLGSGQGSSKAAAGDEAARNALLNTSLIAEITAQKKRDLS
jgi:ribonuclease-3